MRIGELASRLGIPASTIRYYEQIGLLRSPARSANGYRHYSKEAETRIRQIQTASQLGFPLDTVRMLFSTDEKNVRGKAVEQIAIRLREIESMQAHLKKQRQGLQELLKNLDRAGCAASQICGGTGR